jgi:hypothetical protein
MALYEQSRNPSTGENTGIPPCRGTSSDTPPSLRSGHANRRHTVYKKPSKT